MWLFFKYLRNGGNIKMQHTWEVIHECDDDDGNPTCWTQEINHDILVLTVVFYFISQKISEKVYYY